MYLLYLSPYVFNACEQFCIMMMMMILRERGACLKAIMYPANGTRHWLCSISEYQTQLTSIHLYKLSRFKIQDSRMVYCNFNRNLHGIHSKTEAQVGLFVLNTIKLNCITLTSLVQQVSKVQGGVVPVIVRRAGLLWSQQDFEWLWSVPLSSASLY